MFANVSEDFCNKLPVEKNSATRLGGLSGNSLIMSNQVHLTCFIAGTDVTPFTAEIYISRHIPGFEGVAKSIKALNHKGTKTTKEKKSFYSCS